MKDQCFSKIEVDAMEQILFLVPGYFLLPLILTLLVVGCVFIKIIQISDRQLSPNGLPITAIGRQNSDGKTAEQIAAEEAKRIKDEEEAEFYRKQAWA